MSALRVLFIGGTGIISTACAQLAVQRGMDLTLLNRGQSTTRPTVARARVIHGDAGDPASVARAVGAQEFDVVVNFRAFVPRQVAADIEFFTGRTGQYVFISSASAYQKPPARLPITESTPLRNPFWQYSRDKIACEDLLVAAYRERNFPMTIVRPSHTYDPTLIPLEAGWTAIDRMRRGRPIILHGDGTSLWPLTNSIDFAKGLIGLLGHPQVLGDSFHITTDEVQTWNQIAEQLAAAAGAEAKIVHLASDAIARHLPEWADGTLGDKSHSLIFDNTKIKRVVPDFVATIPFWQGARDIVDWHDADPTRRVVNHDLDARWDAIIAAEPPSA